MSNINADNLLADLRVVNGLVAKYVKDGELSFEEKLRLMYFFKDYGDIGAMFVQDEVKLADISGLSLTVDVAKEIHEEALSFEELYKNHRSQLDAFEVKTACEEYLAPFVKKWEDSDEYSQKVYHEYLDLDHRLDYMDDREPEYAGIQKRCYELYDQQKEASRIAQEARMNLEQARRKLYGLEKFNIRWLYIAIEQISDVMEDVLPGPDKEDGV
jgi:hypothetical protein